jgi:hypothetical protein
MKAKSLQLFIHYFIVIIGYAHVPTAWAWSSKSVFFLAQPIHQLAIDNMLKGKVTAKEITSADLEQMKNEQIDVDQPKNQDAVHSYEHAMRGIGTNESMESTKNKRCYIICAENFVRINLKYAIRKRNKDYNKIQLLPIGQACSYGIPENCPLPSSDNGVNNSNDPNGFAFYLGKAMHALEDASSPTHEFFQAWSDAKTIENLNYKAWHILHELYYPNDRKYKDMLEGSVQYAYAIYLEKEEIPDHFFDASGKLILPSHYPKR